MKYIIKDFTLHDFALRLQAWYRLGYYPALETILKAGLADEADEYISELFPEGVTDEELRDLFRFDGDTLLSALGLMTEDEE